MNIRLIRHATLWLEYAGLTLLVDPMLGEAGAQPPIPNTPNPRPNPLVPLRVPAEELGAPDAVLVTHLHRDHWDPAAAAALGKRTPVYCQPGDAGAIEADGFESVTAVRNSCRIGGITVMRTCGRHGTGIIGRMMGKVSGFVLQAEGEPTVYIAGDTVWCRGVRKALDRCRPDVTVVNAGGARFLQGKPITMDADDVVRLCRYAPYTQAVAVHMEAINHCLVTRQELRLRLEAEGLADRVVLPADGEWIAT